MHMCPPAEKEKPSSSNCFHSTISGESDDYLILRYENERTARTLRYGDLIGAFVSRRDWRTRSPLTASCYIDIRA